MERCAQIEDRRVVVLLVDQKRRPDGQRIDVVGVCGQHRLDETAGAGPVLPGKPEAGELDPGGIDVVGIAAARDDLLDQRACLRLAAGAMIELRQRHLEGELVLGRGDQALEFGPADLDPLPADEKPRHIEGGGGVRRVGLGNRAHLRRGRRRVALAIIVLSQQRAELRQVGEDLGKAEEMRLDRGLVTHVLEQLELDKVKRDVLLVAGEIALDEFERTLQIVRADPLVDQHHAGGRIAGIGLEGCACRIQCPGNITLAQRKRRLGGEHFRILRSGLERRGDMGLGLVEAIDEHHDLGKLDPGADMAGLELDDLVEMGDHALEVLLALVQLGHFEMRRDKAVVELQRIAELEPGLGVFALGDQLQPAFLMLGDALLGAVAGREDDRAGKDQEARPGQGITKISADHVAPNSDPDSCAVRRAPVHVP